jgi:DNA-binding transcriptional LysR family regulator
MEAVMELLQIRYFLTLAKCLSFTQAAKILNTTQPTVSKRIADLEENLRVKLFYRSKHAVMLTAMGELLVEEFQDIEKKISNINEIIKSTQKGDIGKLDIGLHGMMAINRILPNFFEDFIKGHPHIRLNIESYEFKELSRLLLRRELDLIFTFSFEQQAPDTHRLAICRSNCRVYFSQSLNKGLDRQIEFDDLKDKKLIVISEEAVGINAYNHTLEICKQLNYQPLDIIPVKTMESLRWYIESGAGISFLGASYRLAEDNRIGYLELNNKNLQVGTDAIWRRDNHNPSLGACIESIITHLDSQ